VSSWLIPTTADIGLRTFSNSPERLIEETVRGMLGILVSENSSTDLSDISAKTSTWNLDSSKFLTYEMWLVKMLEEVLYQIEINDCWVLDMSVQFIDAVEDGASALDAHVIWIPSELVEREIEIKAVTRHLLQFRELGDGVICSSDWENIPDFEGPGWISDVIFDI